MSSSTISFWVHNYLCKYADLYFSLLFYQFLWYVFVLRVEQILSTLLDAKIIEKGDQV